MIPNVQQYIYIMFGILKIYLCVFFLHWNSGSYRFQQTSINIYVQMLISMWQLNRQHFMCSYHTYTIRQFWRLYCRSPIGRAVIQVIMYAINLQNRHHYFHLCLMSHRLITFCISVNSLILTISLWEIKGKKSKLQIKMKFIPKKHVTDLWGSLWLCLFKFFQSHWFSGWYVEQWHTTHFVTFCSNFTSSLNTFFTCQKGVEGKLIIILIIGIFRHILYTTWKHKE